MLRPLEQSPRWRQAVMQSKRDTLARLAPEDQEQARADQRAARERAVARREASRRRAQTICSMIFQGANIDEISAAVSLSPSGVRQLCARWGIPISRSLQVRVMAVTVADGRIDSLDRASTDRGSTRAQTLEDAMAFLLDDDALLLRRLLHIKRKVFQS